MGREADDERTKLGLGVGGIDVRLEKTGWGGIDL